MAVWENDWDGQTHAAAVTTVNSATSGTAFSNVVGTLTYDTAVVANGDSAIACALSGFGEFENLAGPPTRLTGRLYVQLGAIGSTPRIVQVRNALAATNAGIYANASGQIYLVASTTVGTTTATVSANTWFRIEWDINTTGAWELRLFLDPNSSTATEIESGTGANFSTEFSTVRIGSTNGIQTTRMDGFYMDESGVFPGPIAGDITVPTITMNTIHGTGVLDDTYRASGYNASTDILTITGTAADDVGVTSVELTVDGGAPIVATGTTSWSVPLDISTMTAGQHAISAVAIDAALNESTPATQTIWHSPDGMYGAAATAGVHLIPVTVEAYL